MANVAPSGQRARDAKIAGLLRIATGDVLGIYRQNIDSCVYRQRRYGSNIGITDIIAAPRRPMNQILSAPSQVGLVLQAVRKSAKLSQKQLGAKLGLSQNRVSELEADPGSMRVDQLLAVAAVLGLELQVQARGGAPAVGPEGSAGSPTVDKVEW